MTQTTKTDFAEEVYSVDSTLFETIVDKGTSEEERSGSDKWRRWQGCIVPKLGREPDRWEKTRKVPDKTEYQNPKTLVLDTDFWWTVKSPDICSKSSTLYPHPWTWFFYLRCPVSLGDLRCTWVSSETKLKKPVISHHQFLKPRI